MNNLILTVSVEYKKNYVLNPTLKGLHNYSAIWMNIAKKWDIKDILWAKTTKKCGITILHCSYEVLWGLLKHSLNPTTNKPVTHKDWAVYDNVYCFSFNIKIFNKKLIKIL